MKTCRRAFQRDERGQVVVLMALMIPLFFGLGAVVIDLGNWFVHKRHLQTQVDAAALAPGPEWLGCYHAPDGANIAIANKALEFAGDTNRVPATDTTNFQVQEQADVHVVLNSDVYWSADPYPADNTLDVEPAPTGDGLGDPCNESALDVKATDEDVPNLWGLIPISPSPKAKARVEIRRLQETRGMLPLAVPEVDPEAVAAIFVDEEDGSVITALELIPGSCPSTSWPYSCWALDFPGVEINVDRVGIVVLLSRNDADPSLSGTLTQICGQDPGFVICYAGDGNNDGLLFIHGWTGGPIESLQEPAIRDVQLTDVNCAINGDHSAPYFLLNADCDVLIRARVDFGVPDGTTSAQIAAFPYCVEVSANGVDLTHIETTDEGSLFEGVLSFAAESGRTPVGIDWRSRNASRPNCSNRASGTIQNVAGPYAADGSSGPVLYATVTSGGVYANSLEKQPTPRPLRVTVGLQRSLELKDAREPPIMLRLGSNPGSQTQSLDCDTGSLVGSSGPHANWRNEFIDGCLTEYSVNFDDWDRDGDDEWIDIDCSEHPYGNQPPPDDVNDPTPNCIAIQTGVSAGQFRQAIEARFASPCTPNYWPDSTATDTEVDLFFETHDFANDPRYVTLVVADFTAFSGSGSSQPRPLKIFAGFYYTGSGPVSCPGDDPHPLGVTGSRARFDMWGHFVNKVEWSGGGTPSDTLCQFEGDPAACIATLVE